MNEQQLADLFSEQIDRMLKDEAQNGSPAVDDLSEILGLGQQLTQINFQPTPVAQTAFQTQLRTWFGSTNGGLLTKILGLPKILLLVMGATLTIGTGLGLIALIGSLFAGDVPFDANGQMDRARATGSPAPTAPGGIQPPASNTPESSDPQASATTEATESPTSPTPGSPTPAATSSLGDTLPPTSSVGDTLPSSTPTAIPTDDTNDDIANDGPPGNGNPEENDTADDAHDGETGEGAPENNGDLDRGHGNDLDGSDEDNPGNSSGLSGQGNSGGNSGGGSNNDQGGGNGGNAGGGGRGQKGGKR